MKFTLILTSSYTAHLRIALLRPSLYQLGILQTHSDLHCIWVTVATAAIPVFCFMLTLLIVKSYSSMMLMMQNVSESYVTENTIDNTIDKIHRNTYPFLSIMLMPPKHYSMSACGICVQRLRAFDKFNFGIFLIAAVWMPSTAPQKREVTFCHQLNN